MLTFRSVLALRTKILYLLTECVLLKAQLVRVRLSSLQLSAEPVVLQPQQDSYQQYRSGRQSPRQLRPLDSKI